MTPEQRREAEDLARSLAQASPTGFPLILPRALYDHLKAEGCDMQHMRANEPIPRSL